MKVAIYTLGCKVNQYETQAMERSLRARGHEVVDFADAADAYVVNTCSAVMFPFPSGARYVTSYPCCPIHLQASSTALCSTAVVTM